MNPLKFETEDFTKTVEDAIRPYLDKINEKKNKLNSILIKKGEFEKRLKELETKYDELLNIDFSSIKTHGDNEKYTKNLADTKQDIGVHKDLIYRISTDAGIASKIVPPEKNEFCEVLRNEINKYVVKARLNLAVVIEEMLNEDEKCMGAVQDVYQKYIIKTGFHTTVPLTDFSHFTSNYIPLHLKKVVLKSVVANIKEAIGL